MSGVDCSIADILSGVTSAEEPATADILSAVVYVADCSIADILSGIFFATNDSSSEVSLTPPSRAARQSFCTSRTYSLRRPTLTTFTQPARSSFGMLRLVFLGSCLHHIASRSTLG